MIARVQVVRPDLDTRTPEALSVEAASHHWAGKVGFNCAAQVYDESSLQDFIDRHRLSVPQISASELVDLRGRSSDAVMVVHDCDDG